MPFIEKSNWISFRFSKRFWALLFLLLCTSIPPNARAQTITPERDFDFLLGSWKVIEKEITIKDTIYHGTSLYKIYKSHDGTTIKDDWIYRDNDTVMFKATMLRNYDIVNKRWMLFYADNKYNSQIWEGKLENNEWLFYRERLRDGKKIIIKIKWKLVHKKLIQQFIYRSFDDGKSWVLGSILDYTK